MAQQQTAFGWISFFSELQPTKLQIRREVNFQTRRKVGKELNNVENGILI